MPSVSQWASSVLNFSSQRSTTDSSAAQTLGTPNTTSYGDATTAWAPGAQNGSQEYLTLGFTTPVNATGVLVRETSGNGFITQVDLLDVNNVLHTVWTGTDSCQAGSPAEFSVNFAATSYLVKGVKIYADTDHNLATWEEIDAVRLDADQAMVDNLDSGYSEQGGGWSGVDATGGYNGTYRYAAANTGSTAVWQMSSLAAGTYEVQATWLSNTNRATNAPYQIYDGTTLLRTVTINQQQTPAGTTVNGMVFQSLGTFAVASGTLKVSLSSNANNYVIADAVRMTGLGSPSMDLNWSGGALSGPSTANTGVPFTLNRTYTIANGDAPVDFALAYYASQDTVFGNGDDVLLGSETISGSDRLAGTHAGTSPALQLSSFGSYNVFARLDSGDALLEIDESNNNLLAAAPVAVVGAVIVDNLDPGYQEVGGGWSGVGASGGYNGTYRYAWAGSGSAATWQLTGLAAGNYKVQTTWLPYSNRATNAPYQIYDGSTLLQTVLVNQQTAPVAGTTVNSTVFQTLGTYNVSSGTLKVVLSSNANNYVIADAVRVFALPGGVTIQGEWDQTDPEGKLISLDMSIAQSDSGLTYAATGLPKDLGIDEHTGRIEGSLTYAAAEVVNPDPNHPGEDLPRGQYPVTITITGAAVDGEQTRQLLWTVTDVNRLRQPDDRTGDQSDSEGDVFGGDDGIVFRFESLGALDTFDITSQDPFRPLPDGLTLNYETGMIEGTISYAAAQLEQNGLGEPYHLTVTVYSDRDGYDSRTFDWHITDVNRITNPGSETSTEGDEVSLPIIA